MPTTAVSPSTRMYSWSLVKRVVMGPPLFVSSIDERAGVVRRLGAVVRPVVAHDLGDAEPVVGEHPRLADRLRPAVVELAAPGRNRGVVSPELQRQELAFLVEALEALDRDEAVDLL